MAPFRGAGASIVLALLGGVAAQQATQAEVLAFLYRVTGGPSWKNSENWLVGDPCTPGAGWISSSYYDCTTGELTDRPQPVCCEIVRAGANTLEVTKLDLYDNNLVGTLPPELALLPYLRMLVLDENQLSGTIPSEFGKLVDLTTLWLQYNSLSGSIPAELGKLDNFVDHGAHHTHTKTAVLFSLSSLHASLPTPAPFSPGCYLHNNSFSPISCDEETGEPLNLPPPCTTPYTASPTGYLGEFDIPCLNMNLTSPPPPPPTVGQIGVRNLAAGISGPVVVVLSIVGGAACLVLFYEASKIVRRRMEQKLEEQPDDAKPQQEMTPAEREADANKQVAHRRAARDNTSPVNYTHPMSEDESFLSDGRSDSNFTSDEQSACGSFASSRTGSGLSAANGANGGSAPRRGRQTRRSEMRVVEFDKV